MKPVLNISAYLFVPLDDLTALRERIRARALAAGLKGTVLLAGEGINLFLAGTPAAVHDTLDWLREDPRLATLQAKESGSDEVPFRKLLVKVKHEIIRMDHPQVQPASRPRAPAVAPRTLARWLARGSDDEGRPVVMLDTRNAFEVRAGRFRGALDWGLSKFTEFPDAVLRHRQALEGKTVVSYCTGGIRCEKAAMFMADVGIDRVLQLDGGILQYFEDVGDTHFEGECFVFDERTLLGPPDVGPAERA